MARTKRIKGSKSQASAPSVFHLGRGSSAGQQDTSSNIWNDTENMGVITSRADDINQESEWNQNNDSDNIKVEGVPGSKTSKGSPRFPPPTRAGGEQGGTIIWY